MSDAVLGQFKQAEKEKTIDTDRKLKIGIIGCGGIAGAHMGEYLNMPDVEVVAGADLVPGKAKHFFEEKFHVKGRYYNSGLELLENEPDLDGVSICTYNREHAPNAIAALKKGLPVLLEKPFTVTVDEAVEVMKAEKESGKFLSVGFQPRFNENMKMIKKIVQSGILGDIYYIQTGGGRRRGIPGTDTFLKDETAGIGALGDIGCYSLDMILNAMGYPKPVTITGYTSDFFGTNPKYEPRYYDRFTVDDFAAAFIRMDNGCIIDFRISWAMHADTPGDTIIFGKEGALRIPSTDCWNGSVGGEMTLYHDVCGEQVETKIPLIGQDKSNFYLKVRSFLDAIKSGSNVAPVPTSQILINQVILSGIKDSAELGREIEVTVPEV